jgi:hypothetical protein
MSETITAVLPYEGGGRYCREAGFQIVTTEQTITLAIDDESSCCESWGYFLTEDDTEKFIGAELRGVSITDTNRSHRTFIAYGTEGYPGYDAEGNTDLDSGDVMFVDIETDRGVLQFVAYNAHNGYYGHEARVSSKQLEHSETL